MLDLRVVFVHSRQETIKCPYCMAEGQNHGMFPLGATLPATCMKCGETFMVKILDVNIDKTFESLSLSINDTLKSYTGMNITDVTAAKVQEQIKGLIQGYTNFEEVPEIGVVIDNKQLVLVAANNAGIRLLEVMTSCVQGLESEGLIGV